jgi:hypothetical protein
LSQSADNLPVEESGPHGLCGQPLRTAMGIGPGTLAMILLAAFVLGVFAAVRVPPMAAHDEIYHWMRVVQISEGHLFPERVGEEWGGAVNAASFRFDMWLFERFLELQPLKLADVWSHAGELAAGSAETAVVPFSNTATYSPLAYLPQAAGVFLARSVGANVLIQVLAGRLFNVAAYISMLAPANAATATPISPRRIVAGRP